MKLNLGMIVSTSLIFMTIVTSHGTTYAQDTWKFAGWYGGGCYPYVEFDPSFKNRVYLTSDITGLWKSDDAGEHWRFINKGIKNLTVATVSVAPSDSRVVYAGTQGGLFVSNDAGENWSACSSWGNDIHFSRPNSYRGIAVKGNNPNSLCIGTASGAVLCSDDQGATWRDLSAVTAPFATKSLITSLSFTADSQYLLVASGQGLSRYSLANNSWDTRNTAIQHVNDLLTSKTNAGVAYLAADNGIYKSQDYGKTWLSIFSLTTAGKLTRISLYESTSPQKLAAIWENGWNGGVLINSDISKSVWTNADKNLQGDVVADPTRAWAANGGKSTAVKFNPFDGSMLFRTDWWGVFKSVDTGASWMEKITGAPNSCVSDIFIDKQNSVYVATMDNGLLRSKDGGSTYQALFPSTGYRADINGHVWRVSSPDDTLNNIIATSSPWNLIINQFLISKDGGATFINTKTGIPDGRPMVNTLWGSGYPRALAVDPSKPDTIYLGIDGDDGGGLFISNDGGQTWRYSQGQPLSKKIYSGLAVDPLKPNRIFWGACGTNGGVHLSEDGGLTWRQVLTDMDWVFEVKAASDGSIFAIGVAHGVAAIYVSRDHGVTWELLKNFPDEVGAAGKGFSIDPSNSKRMAVSTVRWSSAAAGKIFLTEDGGGSWLDITDGLPDGSGAITTAFSRDGKALYIGLAAGSVYKASLPISSSKTILPPLIWLKGYLSK
jgi:photosystem II stability/assembly factor-like uncharacterized protein